MIVTSLVLLRSKSQKRGSLLEVRFGIQLGSRIGDDVETIKMHKLTALLKLSIQ